MINGTISNTNIITDDKDEKEIKKLTYLNMISRYTKENKILFPKIKEKENQIEELKQKIKDDNYYEKYKKQNKELQILLKEEELLNKKYTNYDVTSQALNDLIKTL